MTRSLSFRDVLKGSPLLAVSIVVVVVSSLLMALYSVIGPFGATHPLTVRVEDLRNPVAITIFLLVAFAFCHLPFLTQPPSQRGLKLYRVIVAPLLAGIFLYVVATFAFIMIGPYTVDLPVTLGLSGRDTPLLFLTLGALLCAATLSWRLSPDEESDRGSACRRCPSIPPALWVVVGVALLIRVWGLSHGLAEGVYHADAMKQISAVSHYLDGEYTFDIDHPDEQTRATIGYPYFSLHFVEAVFRILSVGERFIGHPETSPSNGAVALAARWLNVLYGVVMTVLVYCLARILDFRSEAIWAALLFALSTPQIEMSHYIGADIPMSFFVLCALGVAALNLKRERNRNYLLFGLLAGLGAACKYNGALIFFFPGFIFLKLHPGVKEVVKNLPRMVLALSLFFLVFILTNANLTHSVTEGVAALRVAMDYSAWYAIDGHTLGDKVAWLVANGPYHLFVIGSLFDPVPLWLAAPLLILAAVRKPPLYLWATPLLVFLVGKWSMPVSAPSHYLSILPLLALLTAVGVIEARRRSGEFLVVGRLVGVALVVGLVYSAVQGASLWSLTPLAAQNREWANENVTPEGLYNHGIMIESSFDGVAPTVPGYQQIAHHHYGTDHQAPSLHRDVHRWMFLKGEGTLDFFPSAPFVSGKRETIYPGSHELVTTARVMMTGDWPGLSDKAHRFVLREAPMERIALWVRNMSDRTNEVTFRIGDKKFHWRLGPFETAPLTLVDDPAPTWLYNRVLIPVTVSSSALAVWGLGVTEEEVGDLLRHAGRMDEAKEAYGRSGSVASLLRLLALSDDGERAGLTKKLNVRNPRLLAVDPERDDWWLRVGGYDDTPFRPLMTRPVPYRLPWSDKGERRVRRDATGKERTDWRIEEGGALYGPYMPLAAGYYAVVVTVLEQGGAFTLDVVSGVGHIPLAKRRVTKKSLNGRREIALPFRIVDPVAFPVEIRFLEVEGGGLTLSNIRIRADYQRELREMIRAVAVR